VTCMKEWRRGSREKTRRKKGRREGSPSGLIKSVESKKKVCVSSTRGGAAGWKKVVAEGVKKPKSDAEKGTFESSIEKNGPRL